MVRLHLHLPLPFFPSSSPHQPPSIVPPPLPSRYLAPPPPQSRTSRGDRLLPPLPFADEADLIHSVFSHDDARLGRHQEPPLQLLKSRRSRWEFTAIGLLLRLLALATSVNHLSVLEDLPSSSPATAMTKLSTTRSCRSHHHDLVTNVTRAASPFHCHLHLIIIVVISFVISVAQSSSNLAWSPPVLRRRLLNCLKPYISSSGESSWMDLYWVIWV